MERTYPSEEISREPNSRAAHACGEDYVNRPQSCESFVVFGSCHRPPVKPIPYQTTGGAVDTL